VTKRRPRIGITTSRSANVDRYAAYVAAAGGEPIVLRPGDPTPPEALDGVLFSGGVDVDPCHYGQEAEPSVEVDEERDKFELPLARRAIEAGLPVLGICRGMQLLNVVAGGSLIQDLDGHRVAPGSDRSGHHVVRVAPGSQLAAILGQAEVPVNSRHHQALGEAELAPGLTPTAWSSDGIVEAFERPGDGWLLAVQWHPERVDEVDPACRRLADALVERAARRPRQAADRSV
jgi:gamma-glutamyl-gamma-aminobutyrate hydrolase PuuD